MTSNPISYLNMNNNTYKASIVVPVFKTESFLPHCIESLLSQTFGDFEIVIIDDCSPGNCLSVVEKYRSIKSDIRYFRHKQNLGILSARLTGAERAAGDYVGYLDSDDLARPNFVETLLATASHTHAEIIGSLASENEQSSQFVVGGAEGILKAYADRSLTNYNVWTKMYKRSLILALKDVRIFANNNTCSNSEDLLFNVFCALKNPTYVNIPQVLVDHDRKRKGSSTHPQTVDVAFKAVNECILAYEFIMDNTNGFEEFVEPLIDRSIAFNCRRWIATSDKKDFDWAISAFIRRPSSHRFIASMVRGLTNKLKEKDEKLLTERKKWSEQRQELFAVHQKRKQELLTARQRLTTTREQLKNERKKRQVLKSKIDELLVRRTFAQLLLGLNFLRDRLITTQARARKAWQKLFRQ